MLAVMASVLTLLFGVASGLTREYIFVTTSSNWTEAQEYCRENYQDLATITTNEENQGTGALLGSTSSAWIGMYRSRPGVNIWLWSDGTSSPYIQWANTQPNNANRNQDCVEIKPEGWNDLACGLKRNFVCYRYLILVKEKKTWEEASAYCRMNYIALASLASETQVQLGKMESSQSQTDGVWTGLRFLNRKWLWISQEPLGTWVSVPLCPASRYRCGALNSRTHLWENRDCNEKLNFLCYY